MPLAFGTRFPRDARSAARCRVVACSAETETQVAVAPRVLRRFAPSQDGAPKVALSDPGASGCVLVEWPVPASFENLVVWLQKFSTAAPSEDSDAQFWRRRTMMAMQRKLEVAAGFADDDGREPWRPVGSAPPPLRVFALHPAPAGDGDDAEGSAFAEPVALAMTTDRAFPVEPLDAMHLEQLIAAADAGGAGAALVWAIAWEAAEAGLVMTVEPQSDNLEGYFAHVGFHRSKQIDPYLWFYGGGKVADLRLDLRYPLPTDEDYDRLLSAFKRPPMWIASAEEVYISWRSDPAAREVLTVRVERLEAATFAKASVSRLQRAGVGATYGAATLREDVPVVEAMGVLRNPAMVESVGWQLAEEFYKGSGGLGYVVVGRCTVQSRAYPLPGLVDQKVEMIVESLELPMMQAPIRSVVITTPLINLPEATQAVRNFLDTFRVRASLHRGGNAWGLELVQSDGLVAAVMEPPPLPEDDELPRNIF